MQPLHARLALKTQSEANEHAHWRQRHERRRIQRELTYRWLQGDFGSPHPLPLRVTLTRIAPRALDSDNLPASLKAVQDGVSDWLDQAPGRGQDRKPGLAWEYAQRRGGARDYAVEVDIFPLAARDNGDDMPSIFSPEVARLLDVLAADCVSRLKEGGPLEQTVTAFGRELIRRAGPLIIEQSVSLNKGPRG